MYGEVQVIAWSSLRHVGPQTLRMGSRTPDLGARSCLGPIRDSIVQHVRAVGTPESPRSPSYLGGPSAGPIALAGSAVLLVMAMSWPGPIWDPIWGPKSCHLEIRRTRFRVRTPRLTNLGSQNGHPGRPQIRGPPVELDGIQWNSPLWNVSLDGPLDHLRAFHGIPWSQILRIAHSDLPKWVQNGHFWGPKWSILATFGIKLGPKLVILGSKMAHFGGPNSSEEPRNTLFGGRLPSEYAHLGHLGPFGHMGRKWGILPLFSPF